MTTIAETFIEQGRIQARQEMEQELQKVRQEMAQEGRKAYQEARRARQQELQAKERQGLLSEVELGLELKFGKEGLRLSQSLHAADSSPRKRGAEWVCASYPRRAQVR